MRRAGSRTVRHVVDVAGSHAPLPIELKTWGFIGVLMGPDAIDVVEPPMRFPISPLMDSAIAAPACAHTWDHLGGHAYLAIVALIVYMACLKVLRVMGRMAGVATLSLTSLPISRPTGVMASVMA